MQALIKEWLDKQDEKIYAENLLRQSEHDKESGYGILEEQAERIKEQQEAVKIAQQANNSLEQKIMQHPDVQDYATSKRNNLIKQLNAIISNLHPSPSNVKLSPKQGMITDNYLFGDIYTILFRSILSEDWLLVTPFFMYAVDSNFDEKPLREYLTVMRNELSNLQLNSFIDLYKYVSSKKDGFFALVNED